MSASRVRRETTVDLAGRLKFLFSGLLTACSLKFLVDRNQFLKQDCFVSLKSIILYTSQSHTGSLYLYLYVYLYSLFSLESIVPIITINTILSTPRLFNQLCISISIRVSQYQKDIFSFESSSPNNFIVFISSVVFMVLRKPLEEVDHQLKKWDIVSYEMNVALQNLRTS